MPFTKEEADLSLRSNKVLDDAKTARTGGESCLSAMRLLESSFSAALDIDKNSPEMLGVMRQFKDKALKFDVVYVRMIQDNKALIEINRDNMSTNNKLMVLHGIVSIGKLCEAVLALLPATKTASEVIKAVKGQAGFVKTAIEGGGRAMKGDGAGGASLALEAQLKLLGEKTGALGEIIGGIVAVCDVVNQPAGKSGLETAFEVLAAAGKLFKGIIETLAAIIEILEGEKTAKTVGGPAIFLDVFINLYECFKAAADVYDDFEQVQQAARMIGTQTYRVRRLQRSAADPSFASLKAFERAIVSASMGKAKVDAPLRDFGRAITSHSEATAWGLRLLAETERLKTEMRSAQKTLRGYAHLYGDKLTDLALTNTRMLQHQRTLLDAYKEIVDFEEDQFGPGQHGSLVGQMPGHIEVELGRYDSVLSKTRVRLAITAGMSQAALAARQKTAALPAR